MHVHSKFLSRSFFIISVFFVGLRCSCAELYCADGNISSHVDDEGKSSADMQLSIIKYHVPESLKYRLDSELSVITASESYVERIARYIQNPDEPSDKGNPNLIFLEKIGSANRWSLLCMCADKGYADLVYLLRQNGANEDYGDNDGITPLHRAAFRGHTLVAQLLLKPVSNTSNKRKANALIMDDLGLTPGDYLRIALDRDIHGSHEIEGLLEKAEKYELRKKMSQSIQLRNFISAFRKWSKDNFTSEQVLSIGNVARSSNFLSFSNLFSVLSNVAPSGVSTVMTLAGETASAIEGYLADQETKDFLDHASGMVEDVDDMDREFVKLAYYLADIYEESIQALRPAGAERLGKHTAKYVAEYIKKIDPSHPRNISFVKQAEEYFLTIRDPGMGYRKELDKDGEKWQVHAVLNRTVGNIKASSKSRKLGQVGLAALIRDSHVGVGAADQFDLAEVSRIERLLSGAVIPTYVSQMQETLSESKPPRSSRSTKVDLQGTAYGESRIIGINGELDGDTKVAIETRDASKAINVNIGEIKMSDGTSLSASKLPSQYHKRNTENTETEITAKAYDQSKVIMLNKGTIDNW